MLRRNDNVAPVSYSPGNAPISIQDIVVAGHAGIESPTGEFGRPERLGGKKPPDNESESQLNDRLFNYIHSLVGQAAVKHTQANFQNGKIAAGKENNVTRLVTNEFFFYTQQPLTIPQFQALQQRIFDMAKQQPENLHLILGTFAVRTGDKVMNVAVQIECGREPRLNLTVKNNPSSIDPVYKTTNQDGSIKVLPNIDIRKGDDVSRLQISIDGKPRHFSFNNVFECNTAGGASYHSCIDICLDHAIGTGKKNMDAKIQEAMANPHIRAGRPMPTLCSHVIISNWIEAESRNCLGAVTHADPVVSHINSKPGAQVTNKLSVQSNFGTPATMIMTQPTYCQQLVPREAAKVSNYNRKADPYKFAWNEFSNRMTAQQIQWWNNTLKAARGMKAKPVEMNAWLDLQFEVQSRVNTQVQVLQQQAQGRVDTYREQLQQQFNARMVAYWDTLLKTMGNTREASIQYRKQEAIELQTITNLMSGYQAREMNIISSSFNTLAAQAANEVNHRWQQRTQQAATRQPAAAPAKANSAAGVPQADTAKNNAPVDRERIERAKERSNYDKYSKKGIFVKLREKASTAVRDINEKIEGLVHRRKP